eukprot:gene10394-13960_t
MSYTKNDLVQLYGGAIISSLGGNFKDISNLRQVPDHQEVFVDDSSDISIMVELLDMRAVEGVEGDSTDQSSEKMETNYNYEHIQYYFNDLANSNESIENNIISIGKINDSDGGIPFMSCIINSGMVVTTSALIGTQLTTKFKRKEDSVDDKILVVLVLARLHDVETDMLLSMNIPMQSKIGTHFQQENMKLTDNNNNNHEKNNKNNEDNNILWFDIMKDVIDVNNIFVPYPTKDSIKLSDLIIERDALGEINYIISTFSIFNKFVDSINILDRSLFKTE